MRSEPIMDSDSIPLVDISPENPLCAKKKPVPAIQDDASANNDSANLDDNKLIDAESESHNDLTPSRKEIGGKNDTVDRDENEPIENLDDPILMDSLTLQTLMVWEPSLTLTDT
jgi:hypothetical protein